MEHKDSLPKLNSDKIYKFNIDNFEEKGSGNMFTMN